VCIDETGSTPVMWRSPLTEAKRFDSCSYPAGVGSP